MPPHVPERIARTLHLLTGLLRRAFGWVESFQDLLLLIVALIPVFGVWAFLELADEVVQGETQKVDEWVLRLMRSPRDPADPIGPPWIEEVGRDVTALGGTAVLMLMIAFVAGFLWLRRQYHALVLLMAASLGGVILSNVLKIFYERPRPDVVPHLSYVLTASFPSGHSMMATVVYLTLGALLARFVHETKYRIYFIAVALFLALLVGVSRIYMGVHYPTDVLAGWTAGLIWAVLCWLAAYWLQRRGTVERPGE